MFLLDTVVLSETRKRRPSAQLIGWLKTLRDDDVYLSVVSVGEIQRGIAKARLTDTPFAAELAIWSDDLVRLYGDRILPITAPIAKRWGELSQALGHDGADLLIAATALTHGLQVATRNVKHFEPTGVQVFNPFGLGKSP